MRFFPMRCRDRELDKKEREECKNCCLQKADKNLEKHEGYRRKVGREENRHRDDSLACKDVAEEPKCERKRSRKLTDEFNDSNKKSDRTAKIKKFFSVLICADGDDAGNLDHEK